MILRIKKRDLITAISTIIFAVSLFFAISAPFIYAITTNTTKINFKVDLVISNRNPTINVSNATFSIDPVAGANSIVLISFNVTDADGAGNINASTAVVNFTLGGVSDAQYYTNISAVSTSEFGNCNNHSESSTVVTINCTVALPYYVNSSANWVVNISVKDIAGGVGRNDTLRFTVNSLSSISLPNKFVNFSNVNLGQQNAQAFPHLLINNTGNDDFDLVNITAAALIGTTVTSESIAASNIYANATNNSLGNGLQLGTAAVSLIDIVTSKNVSLQHGNVGAFAPNKDKGNLSVFFWIDVPSSGLSSQLYNATWNLTVE